MRTAFVTGSTGFLGSHFLLNSYAANYDQFICMVRGATPDLRRKKIELALTHASNSYSQPYDISAILQKCHIINGDLNVKNCGINPDEVISYLNGNTFDFWHFAAS
ncbi:MAG: SDR family oxidoreductase, partial [Pseudomonadota bacterium]